MEEAAGTTSCPRHDSWGTQGPQDPGPGPWLGEGWGIKDRRPNAGWPEPEQWWGWPGYRCSWRQVQMSLEPVPRPHSPPHLSITATERPCPSEGKMALSQEVPSAWGGAGEGFSHGDMAVLMSQEG